MSDINPNEKQVGGSHYQTSEIQHWDFTAYNGLPYLEGCATKYVSRWRSKGGIQDLEKAFHYLEKLTQLATEGIFAGPVCLAIPPEDFCSANNLGEQETEIIIRISSWRSLDDIGVCLKLIREMINEAKSRRKPPGGTGQESPFGYEERYDA